MNENSAIELQLIHLFVHLVSVGGFSQAATKLNMPVATVSRKIAKLEAALNTQLIMRSTRKLRLTEEGAELFERYSKLIYQFDELQHRESRPTGTLRIATPISITSMILIEAFNEFSKLYPEINLHISQNNQTIDLIDEGVDVAIVGGAQPDSSWVSKSLGVLNYGLFASKNYLASAAEINHPQTLNQHNLIKVWPLFNWNLTKGTEQYYYDGEAKITLADLYAAVRLAVNDGGILYGPELFVKQQLAQGQLVKVLPQWRGENRRICLLYHQRKQQPQKVKLFIDFMLSKSETLFDLH
ncbi:LysR family transcriptional regulator [Shewanella aestuarii]|uniref:LysR family transcriptional regulator n=1 Tax=Shewanella aestuarii TaxID=1028752 RepID=A0A6G9QK48_9GAMM|nr:LysR family transcriptional regulator [Shewanella aestuarii]QIR14447.1 LysR family transcriptional regulator [Shewanella aestuarii]